MELVLNRKHFTDKSTIGELSINGHFICYTLEDACREKKDGSFVKIAKQTAIRAGIYPIILSLSKRFGKVMPELLKVLDFLGIRIHCGNDRDDTEGCILVGLNRGQDKIYNCASAFKQVFNLISGAISRGEKVYITIKGIREDETIS